MVEAIETLASPATDVSVPELIGRLFVNLDDLDSALVGAEDSLAGLVDRFDLNDDSTAELKAKNTLSPKVRHASRLSAPPLSGKPNRTQIGFHVPPARRSSISIHFSFGRQIVPYLTCNIEVPLLYCIYGTSIR